MILLIFSLVFIGFIALSLAMNRHHLQLRPNQRQPSTQKKRLYRFMGYSCLLLAGIFSIADQGIAVGLVFYSGLITVVALSQSLLFSYRPQWVMPIGVGVGAIVLILGAANGITR